MFFSDSLIETQFACPAVHMCEVCGSAALVRSHACAVTAITCAFQNICIASQETSCPPATASPARPSSWLVPAGHRSPARPPATAPRPPAGHCFPCPPAGHRPAPAPALGSSSSTFCRFACFRCFTHRFLNFKTFGHFDKMFEVG